jgi:hypothetical protein
MDVMRRLRAGLAVALVGSLALGPVNVAAQGSSPGLLSGTAKHKAKQPYSSYTVRARDVAVGTIAGTIVLDSTANFSLRDLALANYLVELVDKRGKVVCTEGPFNLTQAAAQKTNVNIDCGVPPTAWLLVAGAAAAGITAGVVTGGDEPAAAPRPQTSQFSSPASASQ